LAKQRRCALRLFVEHKAPSRKPTDAAKPMTRSAVFAPFELIDGDRTRGLLLLGDHAKRETPAEYGRLGLPAAEFERHIAYDIGVEALARALAARLGAPCLLANFSRLLIDPNRGEDDPTLIRQLYDGTIIDGNYPMSEEEREARLARFYRPYHEAVGALSASVAAASGAPPFLVSLHSFTPRMQGVHRPWHVGVLWDADDRAARALIDMLASDPELCVGDNEPYDGALRGDTMYRHAIVNGFAHALIEVRQDLIDEEEGASAWASRLAPLLEQINARPEIHEARLYSSRTGPF
jgi:predicted N-formylglutamate amidohydrolase